MAEFEVLAVKIDDVVDHPDADRLSLNKIGGYVAVSNKLEDGSHRYAPGQVVIYIPEGAVVPDYLLQRMGFWKEGKGTLAGSRGDRVKAAKLRGIVSQGLILPGSTALERPTIMNAAGDARWISEGDNYAEFLGIVKYEPPIPAGMQGDLIASNQTLKFDVENGQKYPDVFQSDDYVYVTEKLHGTFCAFVFHREPQEGWIKIHDNLYATAYSKGLGGRGLVFKATEKNLTSNLYMRTLNDYIKSGPYMDFIQVLLDNYDLQKMTLLGEIYGRGVQDLTYSRQTPQFAAFDLVLDNKYVDQESFWGSGTESMPRVPLLFEGEFQDLEIEALRDGKSSIDNSTLREGIVVRGEDPEIRDERIGRKMVKYVSPDYLTRKGGTELQ